MVTQDTLMAILAEKEARAAQKPPVEQAMGC